MNFIVIGLDWVIFFIKIGKVIKMIGSPKWLELVMG